MSQLLHHFQDDTFVVEHVADDILLELIGFSEDGPSHPEKLLLHLERSGWSSCFLGAFIAHWNSLDDSQLQEVLGDYSDIPRTDYCELWPLRGTRILSIAAARSDRVTVTIATTAGTLLFREVDASDPHSDSEFLWQPEPAG